MSQQIPNNWKRCSTCAYWAGERVPCRNANYITVPSETAYGQCLNKNGGYGGHKTQGSSCCRSYEKWAVLK